jgi:hypothetical protein
MKKRESESHLAMVPFFKGSKGRFSITALFTKEYQLEFSKRAAKVRACHCERECLEEKKKVKETKERERKD